MITITGIDNCYLTAVAEFVWAVSECCMLIQLDAGNTRHDIVGQQAVTGLLT